MATRVTVAVCWNRDTLGCGCSNVATTARRPRPAITCSHFAAAMVNDRFVHRRVR